MSANNNPFNPRNDLNASERVQMAGWQTGAMGFMLGFFVWAFMTVLCSIALMVISPLAAFLGGPVVGLVITLALVFTGQLRKITQQQQRAIAKKTQRRQEHS